MGDTLAGLAVFIFLIVFSNTLGIYHVINEKKEEKARRAHKVR